VRYLSVTQQANYQTFNQSNIHTPVSLIILVTGVFLITRAVTYKEYRAKKLRRQINTLEAIWLQEYKENKL
jgi:Ca2+/H+ antiporter